MRVINVTPEMSVLPLGRLGENEVTQFVFDVSDWLEEYPGGSIGLANSLPHARNGYACSIEREGDGKYSWTITSAELTTEGKGRCELILIKDSKVKKGKVYKTLVGEALDPDADPPEAWKGYVTKVMDCAAAVLAAAHGQQIRFSINDSGHLVFSYSEDEEVTEETEWTDVDLGPVNAYAMAVLGGYSGTASQFEQYMADIAKGAASASASATSAAASAADALEHTQSVIETWLGNNITPGSQYALDRTLALSYAAAPADLVGGIKSAINDFTESTRNLMPLYSSVDTNAEPTLIDDGYRITSKNGNQYLNCVYWVDVRNINKITVSWGKYTGTGSGGIRISRMNAAKEYISWIGWATEASAVTDTTGGFATFDVSGEDYIGIAMYSVRSENQAIGAYIEYKNVQVEVGETATAYIPRISAVDIELRNEVHASVVETFSVSDKTLADQSLWEAGTINPTTGEPVAGSACIRTKKYIKVDAKTPVYLQAYYVLPEGTSTIDVEDNDNYNIRNAYIAQYDKKGVFISRTTITSQNTLKGYSVVLNADCAYIRIALYTRVSGTDVSEIMPSTIWFDLVTDFTAVAATFNNIGPGLGGVGPAANFNGLNLVSKFVLMFDMLAGRLELYPMLILFLPRIWKKHM